MVGPLETLAANHFAYAEGIAVPIYRSTETYTLFFDGRKIQVFFDAPGLDIDQLRSGVHSMELLATICDRQKALTAFERFATEYNDGNQAYFEAFLNEALIEQAGFKRLFPQRRGYEEGKKRFTDEHKFNGVEGPKDQILDYLRKNPLSIEHLSSDNSHDTLFLQQDDTRLFFLGDKKHSASLRDIQTYARQADQYLDL